MILSEVFYSRENFSASILCIFLLSCASCYVFCSTSFWSLSFIVSSSFLHHSARYWWLSIYFTMVVSRKFFFSAKLFKLVSKFICPFYSSKSNSSIFFRYSLFSKSNFSSISKIFLSLSSNSFSFSTNLYCYS